MKIEFTIVETDKDYKFIATYNKNDLILYEWDQEPSHEECAKYMEFATNLTDLVIYVMGQEMDVNVMEIPVYKVH